MTKWISEHFNVTFRESENFNVKFTEGEKFNVSFGNGIEKEYHGAYEVAPSAETQTLHTTNRVLTHEIVIDPIPSNYGLITWNGLVLTVS